MKQILILLLFGLSNVAAASVAEHRYSCVILDGFGDYRSAIQFTLRTENELPRSISFAHKDYLREAMIHRRQDNAFLGGEVYVSPPPFASFNDWARECRASVAVACEMADYELARAEYYQNARTFRRASEIEDSDPVYFTVDSQVVSNLEGSMEVLPSSGPAGSPFGRFVSARGSAIYRSRATNAYVRDALFQEQETPFDLIFDNNAISYVLRLRLYVDESALSRVYGCEKRELP